MAIEQINTSKTISDNRKQVMINQNGKTLETLDRYKDIGNYFAYLPYFSNIIVDNEGNLLIFEFTGIDDTVSNIFNVIAYDSTGKKLARTSFICDDFDISFSESTFVIANGYMYAVAKLKNSKGMPLRLVKLKIAN